MDQVHVIRHKVRMEGRSVRRVAREMRLSRNTVRRYLDHEVPIGVRRATARPAPVREVVEPRLEALLASTAAATGGKQRLTTTRLHGLLVGDGSRLGSRWSRSSWRSDGDERRRCSCRSCTSRATWARSTSSRYWSTWQASGARRGCFRCERCTPGATSLALPATRSDLFSSTGMYGRSRTSAAFRSGCCTTISREQGPRVLQQQGPEALRTTDDLHDLLDHESTSALQLISFHRTRR